MRMTFLASALIGTSGVQGLKYRDRKKPTMNSRNQLMDKANKKTSAWIQRATRSLNAL